MSDTLEATNGTIAEESADQGHRRGVALLPMLFTMGNIFCGYYAVLSIQRGTASGFSDAARAIGFAILFDALDGRVARATGTNSEFGKQFDSLADVISFGIAPAFLAYAWGVHSFFNIESGLQRNVYLLGCVIPFLFMICCAWRLARFNIHGMAPGKESKYFVGMPTPAAAGVIAASVHALKEPVQDWRFALGWLFLVGVVAALMTSSIRYYGFKDISLRRRRSSFGVVMLLGPVVAFTYYFPEYMLLLLAGSYLISGITLHLLRNFRTRPPASPASVA